MRAKDKPFFEKPDVIGHFAAKQPLAMTEHAILCQERPYTSPGELATPESRDAQ
jgi:hypothetical protein